MIKHPLNHISWAFLINMKHYAKTNLSNTLEYIKLLLFTTLVAWNTKTKRKYSSNYSVKRKCVAIGKRVRSFKIPRLTLGFSQVFMGGKVRNTLAKMFENQFYGYWTLWNTKIKSKKALESISKDKILGKGGLFQHLKLFPFF